VPEAKTLLEFLEQPRGFFSLSDVTLLAQDTKLPFLAVARSAVTLLIPAEQGQLQPESRASARTKIRSVSCIFEGGMVMGSLAISADARVSDELMASPGFFLLEQCTVGIDDGAGPVMEANPIVLLHAPRLVGVAEVG